MLVAIATGTEFHLQFTTKGQKNVPRKGKAKVMDLNLERKLLLQAFAFQFCCECTGTCFVVEKVI